MNIQSFEDLEVWGACRGVRLFVMRVVVPKLPPAEKFRLTDQLIRAVRSSTANIAEGYGRFHHLDNVKFCSNARGSLQESLDHLITAHDDGFITTADLDEARPLVTTALKLLNGYMSYLRRASPAAQQPQPAPTLTPNNQ